MTGHLAHAATVIRPGRIFLRPLFALIATAAKPHHYVHLNLSVRADLCWWLHFLQSWNGSSFFSPPLPSVHVYSDASGSFGCVAFSRPHGWFQLQWPPTWLSVNIATKEFVPVVTAAALWGRQWAGSHVCFHVDNLAVVSILNKRSAKDPLLSSACSFSLPFITFTSLPFITFTSLPNIFLAAQTLPLTLCLMTIFTFLSFWSHRCCRPLSHPPFRSSSYSRHPTGPHLAGPVCFVSPCPGTCFLHTCDI